MDKVLYWADHLYAKLADQPFRLTVYSGLGLLFFCLSFARSSVIQQGNFIVSDGQGYYLYLPTILIGGNFDFASQVQKHPETTYDFKRDQEKRGLHENKYPLGFALTLSPSFLFAHLVSKTIWVLTGWRGVQPDGYSWFYQIFCLIWIMFLGILSLLISERLVRTHFQIDTRIAALAALLYWVGTNYTYYYFREPFMVHVVSSFWVTLSIFAIYRLGVQANQIKLQSWSMMLAVFSTSMALICRPTNIFLVSFWVVLLFQVFVNRAWRPFASVLPAGLLGVFPAALQMLYWNYTRGQALYYSYGKEGFHWLRPSLWLTLFSWRFGIFLGTPLLLLVLLGVYWRLKYDPSRKDWLLWGFLGAFVLLWYFNSSWYGWWFGDSFGARAFIELSSFYVVGLAFALDFIRRLSSRSQLMYAMWIILCILYNCLTMLFYIVHWIPRSFGKG